MASRWNNYAIDRGFLQLPNLLITHHDELGIDEKELMFIIKVSIHKDTFKLHDDQVIKGSQKTAYRRRLSLKKKGLIEFKEHKEYTSSGECITTGFTYDLSILNNKLQELSNNLYKEESETKEEESCTKVVDEKDKIGRTYGHGSTPNYTNYYTNYYKSSREEATTVGEADLLEDSLQDNSVVEEGSEAAGRAAPAAEGGSSFQNPSLLETMVKKYNRKNKNNPQSIKPIDRKLFKKLDDDEAELYVRYIDDLNAFMKYNYDQYQAKHNSIFYAILEPTQLKDKWIKECLKKDANRLKNNKFEEDSKTIKTYLDFIENMDSKTSEYLETRFGSLHKVYLDHDVKKAREIMKELSITSDS